MPNSTRSFRQRHYALFWLLPILLSPSLSSGSDLSCAKLYAVTAQFEFQDPRITGTSLLGEGKFGRVELRKNLKGQYVAHKTYKVQGPSKQMNSDFRALQFLSNYKYRFSFQLPKIEKLTANTWIMDYHPGRTVADLIADPGVKSQVKSQIESNYAQMARELLEFLRDQEFEIDKTLVTGLLRFSALNDEYALGTIEFIIKPDNVLVDPTTLKLTLIDPN